MIWRGKSFLNSHYQKSNKMKQDQIAFYNNSLQMEAVLTLLFNKNHPCHELALQMTKYPLVMTGPECPLIVQEVIGGILHCCLSTSLKSCGAAIIAKREDGRLTYIKTQDDINLNVGDQIITELFPDSIQQTMFQVSKKTAKIDFEGIKYIYHLEPLLDLQVFQ